LISLHPEDSNFFGDNETFNFGSQNQGPNSTNNEKGNEQMLHTPPSLKDEDLPPKVLKKSPPKTTSRAPTVQYDICVSFRRPKERLNNNKFPDTCVVQYTIYRAQNAYRQLEFYKALAMKARSNRIC